MPPGTTKVNKKGPRQTPWHTKSMQQRSKAKTHKNTMLFHTFCDILYPIARVPQENTAFWTSPVAKQHVLLMHSGRGPSPKSSFPPPPLTLSPSLS